MKQLDAIKNLLRDFDKCIQEKIAFYEGMRLQNPGFSPVSEKRVQERISKFWLIGATDTFETTKLELWLYEDLHQTATAKKKAKNIITVWRKKLEDKEPFGSYYDADPNFKVPNPSKDETLFDYVVRLVPIITNNEVEHPLEIRAIKSFLDFARNHYPDSETAFIEHIFPKKMNVFDKQIIRKITSEVYAIPRRIASVILEELATMCLSDRPDAQLAAAESLALCWICLTASRMRLPVQIEELINIEIAALKRSKSPIIEIPTLFGNRPVKISKLLSRYLFGLYQIPSTEQRETILQKPLRSLNRTLQKAVQKVNEKEKQEYDDGKISYMSFLTPPHNFGIRRYQPK